MKPKNKLKIWGKVWSFKTARFQIALTIEREENYKYDGDDEGGEIQRKIDSGEYKAFVSKVSVELDGEEIASDYLGGSVYTAENMPDFWQGHRDSNPKNRNCSFNDYRVGHYFPDMVKQVCEEARKELLKRKALPYIRTKETNHHA